MGTSHYGMPRYLSPGKQEVQNFSLKLKEQKNSDGYIFLQKTIFFMKILNIFIFGGNFLKINFEF